jgi:hypothetical protein
MSTSNMDNFMLLTRKIQPTATPNEQQVFKRRRWW